MSSQKKNYPKLRLRLWIHFSHCMPVREWRLQIGIRFFSQVPFTHKTKRFQLNTRTRIQHIKNFIMSQNVSSFKGFVVISSQFQASSFLNSVLLLLSWKFAHFQSQSTAMCFLFQWKYINSCLLLLIAAVLKLDRKFFYFLFNLFIYLEDICVPSLLQLLFNARFICDPPQMLACSVVEEVVEE